MFLKRCAVSSFQVCCQIYVMLTFTTLLGKQTIFCLQIVKKNFFSRSFKKCMAISAPQNFFSCFVFRELKKVENLWSKEICMLCKQTNKPGVPLSSSTNKHYFYFTDNTFITYSHSQSLKVTKPDVISFMK